MINIENNKKVRHGSFYIMLDFFIKYNLIGTQAYVDTDSMYRLIGGKIDVKVKISSIYDSEWICKGF